MLCGGLCYIWHFWLADLIQIVVNFVQCVNYVNWRKSEQKIELDIAWNQIFNLVLLELWLLLFILLINFKINYYTIFVKINFSEWNYISYIIYMLKIKSLYAIIANV